MEKLLALMRPPSHEGVVNDLRPCSIVQGAGDGIDVKCRSGSRTGGNLPIPPPRVGVVISHDALEVFQEPVGGFSARGRLVVVEEGVRFRAGCRSRGVGEGDVVGVVFSVEILK